MSFIGLESGFQTGNNDGARLADGDVVVVFLIENVGGIDIDAPMLLIPRESAVE